MVVVVLKLSILFCLFFFLLDLNRARFVVKTIFAYQTRLKKYNIPLRKLKAGCIASRARKKILVSFGIQLTRAFSVLSFH